MGNGLITNPSAQQGEDPLRNDARGPANTNANIAPHGNDDSLKSGPEEIPGHVHPISREEARKKAEESLRDPSPSSMRDKIDKGKR